MPIKPQLPPGTPGPRPDKGSLMFERYTDRARRSLVLARDEARTLNHRAIDVHHMLGGLALEGEGFAARALARTGLDAAALRAAAVTLAPPEPGPLPMSLNLPFTNLPFTPRARKAMDLALREAIGLAHNFIGTEHLLLGLMREAVDEGSPCGAVLQAVNVTSGDVREAVLGLLRGYEKAEAGRTQPEDMTGTAARLARLLAGASDADLALALGALGPKERERIGKALEEK